MTDAEHSGRWSDFCCHSSRGVSRGSYPGGVNLNCTSAASEFPGPRTKFLMAEPLERLQWALSHPTPIMGRKIVEECHYFLMAH